MSAKTTTRVTASATEATTTATETTASAEATSATAAAAGLVDLGGRVAQGRADLVDLELHDGALLALAGLVRAALESALHDHPHALGERLGHVLRGLAPHGTVEEHGIAVLPFAGVPVERAGGGRHREVGDRCPGRREAQLGIGRQVADERDGGFACHVCVSEIGRGRVFSVSLSGPSDNR